MNVGAKHLGVRARTAAFWISKSTTGESEKAALRARTSKRFAPVFLLLPLVSTVLLVALDRAQEIFPMARVHPMLTFPALVIGSWPGLALLGHVADAYGATAPAEARHRILNDRYIGSFGVCAMAVSVLVQISAVLTTQPLSLALAALPVSTALIGSLCGCAAQPGQALARLGAFITVVVLSVLFFLAAANPDAVAISGAAALVAAWLLRDGKRHGLPIAGPIAAHAAFLSLLLIGRW
jgi:cobalamin synthase